jgi:hypothetical protein
MMMDALKKFMEEYKILQSEEEALKLNLQNLEFTKREYITRLEQIKGIIYKKKIALCHMEEIFRLAGIQFPRLRNYKPDHLTEEDNQELIKWIGRAKSEDGLKDIIDALNELGKYRPIDIKTNLYALVQKIIIGGAYKEKKKK